MRNQQTRDNVSKRKTFQAITEFCQSVMTAFFVAILVMTLTGTFIGDSAKDISSFYQFKNGIAYRTIWEWLLTSCVIALWGILFHSEKISRKLMAFWRYSLNMIAIVITIIIFSACFNWFPLNNPVVWFVFFLCFSISFGFTYLITWLKIKSEAKLYDKLLENYKRNQEEEINQTDERESEE